MSHSKNYTKDFVLLQASFREALQDGSETHYDVWFVVIGINQKTRGWDGVFDGG